MLIASFYSIHLLSFRTKDLPRKHIDCLVPKGLTLLQLRLLQPDRTPSLSIELIFILTLKCW